MALCPHCSQPLPNTGRSRRYDFAKQYTRTTSRDGKVLSVVVEDFTNRHARSASSALQDQGLPLHAANWLIMEWNNEGARVSQYNDVLYQYALAKP